MQNAKLQIQNLLAAFCIFHFAFLIGSCSLPSLESPECAEARVVAKQFYSFHFGNDMKPSAESLKLRERFLTSKFFLEASSDIRTLPIDPFTGTDPPPTTFKIGKCVSNEREAGFEVQFYWRTDASTTQRTLHVTLVREDDRWLINHIGGHI